MIKWISLAHDNDGINSLKYVSEDGRFEIKKEVQWNLYDEKAPDKRWFRYSESTIQEAKKDAERILEEEQSGNDPYGRR